MTIHMKYFHSKKKLAKLTSNDSRKNESTKTLHETRIQSNSSTPSNALSGQIQSVHEKLKPHQCSFCAKQFSFKKNLKLHIDSVHNNIKRHACQICNKGFRDNYCLRMHIECVHEKMKKHVCSKCNKPFGQKSYLNSHMKRVH